MPEALVLLFWANASTLVCEPKTKADRLALVPVGQGLSRTTEPPCPTISFAGSRTGGGECGEGLVGDGRAQLNVKSFYRSRRFSYII